MENCRETCENAKLVFVSNFSILLIVAVVVVVVVLVVVVVAVVNLLAILRKYPLCSIREKKHPNLISSKYRDVERV